LISGCVTGKISVLFMISVTNLHFSEIEGSACYIAVGLEFK